MGELSNNDKIDKILSGHAEGICGAERATDTLKRVLAPLGEWDRAKCLDHAFTILVRQVRARVPADATAGERQRQSINILFKVLFEFGRLDGVLCEIFAYFDPEDPTVVSNWVNYVFQEITSAVYAYSDSLAQSTLDKDQNAYYLNPALAGRTADPDFASSMSVLNRAIKSAEFSRFERQLRNASPEKPEDGGKQPAEAGLNLIVVDALKKARDYLHSDGPFDPKIAGDLMRASVEETGRDMVARLGALTGTRYAGPDKDFNRRAYLRKVGFINLAEEKFLTAIYGILSGEGSHKLIAPRETMLVMERTVQDYLLLLVRRLSDFNPPKLGNS